MPLTANRDLDHYVDQELRTLSVAAAKHVYQGALVGVNANGYAQPLIAGDAFAGIAYEEADNSTGADGAKTLRVYTVGDFGHALAGATQSSIGRPVFAGADDTLTYSGTGNSYIGVTIDVPAAGQIIVRLDTSRGQIKTVMHQVEDLSAGADVALRAAHVFDSEGWLVAARVVNQAIAAAGIDNSNTCVVTVQNGAQTVVSSTFNLTNTFPAVNTSKDLGVLANVHVLAGGVLNVSVTNGTTANPGPFLIEVDYV